MDNKQEFQDKVDLAKKLVRARRTDLIQGEVQTVTPSADKKWRRIFQLDRFLKTLSKLRPAL